MSESSADHADHADHADTGVQVRRRKLTDYVSDPHNANRGSERGRKLIRDSLSKRGAGRSLLSSADDVMIAGNQTMEQALDAGIRDVIEVETDGSALVVVKRRDVDSTDPRFRQMAYDDNRSRDHAEYAMDVIESDWNNQTPGFDMSDYFDADEIEEILAAADAEAQVNAALSGEGNSGVSRGLTGDKARQIKPVLYVQEVAIVERAIKAAGIEQRGAALVKVCQFYLDHHPSTTTAEAEESSPV